MCELFGESESGTISPQLSHDNNSCKLSLHLFLCLVVLKKFKNFHLSSKGGPKNNCKMPMYSVVQKPSHMPLYITKLCYYNLPVPLPTAD